MRHIFAVGSYARDIPAGWFKNAANLEGTAEAAAPDIFAGPIDLEETGVKS